MALPTAISIFCTIVNHTRLKRVTLFSFLVLIASITFGERAAFSQQLAGRTIYSNHHVGDTLPLLPNEEGYDSHLLLFANASLCFTCTLALEQFQAFAKQYHTSVTMVIEGQSQQYADSEKVRAGWTAFTMIGDPLHLYQKAYEVLDPFCYFLTDRNGKIIAHDKIAGVNVSFDSLQSLIEKASQAKPLGRPAFPVLKEFTLSDSSGSPIVVGAFDYVIPFVHSSSTVILDASFHRLYVADSAGRVVRTFSLKFYINPSGISWAIPNQRLLLRFPTSTCNCMLYTLDIRSGNFQRKSYDESAIPKGCRMPNAWVDPLSGSLYGDLYPLDGTSKVDPNQPMILMFDSLGHFLRSFGKPEKRLTEYVCSDVADSYLGFDFRGRLYEVESPAEAIKIYRLDGNLIRRIALKFGSNWKPYAINLPRNISNHFWIRLLSTTSGEGLLFVPGDSLGAVTYINVKFKQGETDPIASDAVRTYFIHVIHSDFTQGADVELPKNAIPRAVGKDYCLATQYLANHLRLIWYQLKN